MRMSMHRHERQFATCLTLALLAGCQTSDPRKADSPEQRALAFLQQEVPAWSRDNRCFSCHNNGDAARALYAASQRGFPIREQALVDTTDWVSHPDRWDHNKGDPGFSDKRLANLQFAASLVAARAAGESANHDALLKAVQRVAGDQAGNGSWPVESEGTLGSPATYGPTLATRTAVKVLRHAGWTETNAVIARADVWLRKQKPATVLDASALLLAFSEARDDAAVALREQSLTLLRRAQTSDGGWGPYLATPPEPFDTAIALLALKSVGDDASIRDMLRRGRAFLIENQQPGGNWTETTRPARGQSYAQMMSTTGWATLALLETGD
jgi:hypothetical protein